MTPGRDRDEMFDAARQASMTMLCAHIGWTPERARDDLAGALQAAMEAIPREGEITDRTEQLLLNALTWLAGELPAWEPLRMVIEQFTADAMRRLPSLDGETW
ncbi:MAG TPA: hypothetical protein VMK65_04925 [Longimicrobiales bacterium]|nr:hypothetical protein [Longimicrobiales bacterium]